MHHSSKPGHAALNSASDLLTMVYVGLAKAVQSPEAANAARCSSLEMRSSDPWMVSAIQEGKLNSFDGDDAATRSPSEWRTAATFAAGLPLLLTNIVGLYSNQQTKLVNAEP